MVSETLSHHFAGASTDGPGLGDGAEVVIVPKAVELVNKYCTPAFFIFSSNKGLKEQS